MNENISNGSSGIEYDVQPCLHMNIFRQIEFNQFIETLCDVLSINRNDEIWIIFSMVVTWRGPGSTFLSLYIVNLTYGL